MLKNLVSVNKRLFACPIKLILDQFCVTGVVAEAVYDAYKTQGQQGARQDWYLECTNLAPPMLEAMEGLANSRNWANANIAKSSTLHNDLATRSFDYVYASLSAYYAVNSFGFSGPQVEHIIGSEMD